MKHPLIIALDFSNIKETEAFLSKFDNKKLFVKVGMELFYREGANVLTLLKNNGHQVFLDLKLHDIPTTVKKAMKNLAELGVDIVNVHASGGSQMMSAALEGLEQGTSTGMDRPKCIAVTQLTSTSKRTMNDELLIKGSLDMVVEHYAMLTKKSGLDGVVCSTWEVEQINKICGHDFLTVTPGIRLKTDAIDDQVRIATPEEAKKQGASAIVVGRSITKAVDPVLAYEHVRLAWEGK